MPSAEFWDRVARRYSQQPVADAESYARKLAATQSLMHPEMKVLEFGCGTGTTALAHASHVGEIIATDISSEMVAIARRKAEDAGVSNVRFEQSSIENFKAPDDSFDMVLTLNLLHLLQSPLTALSRIHQLLKTGGYFVSSTACLSDRMWFLRPVIPVMQWLGKAPYVGFLSAGTILDGIESEGFEVLEHWTHGRANTLFVIAKKR